MPHTPVAADVHESLDVHGGLRAKRTLHPVPVLNDLPELVDVFVRELVHPSVRTHARLVQDRLRRGATNPEDVSQADHDPLVPGEVNASYSCHVPPNQIVDP